MRMHVACLVLALLAQGCGPKQKPVETEPVQATPDGAAPAAQETPAPPTEEDQEATARTQVADFLDAVRTEKYEQAYEEGSFLLRDVYSFDQFLMIAGKLQMEEMPCISEENVSAMERTTGHVGIGPKDVEVHGFLIRYACGDEARILFVLLDWGGEWTPPGGVASVWWKPAPQD
jgi:hypothetical protein